MDIQDEYLGRISGTDIQKQISRTNTQDKNQGRISRANIQDVYLGRIPGRNNLQVLQQYQPVNYPSSQNQHPETTPRKQIQFTGTTNLHQILIFQSCNLMSQTFEIPNSEFRKINKSRAAVVHLNLRAGSTFSVQVCTVSPGHWLNKANTRQY